MEHMRITVLGWGLACAAACAQGAATLPLQARQQATAQTAQSGQHCTALGDFYWEIGDARGPSPLASGRVGRRYGPDSALSIASASKWLWGAFVLQGLPAGSPPSPAQVAALQMRSGYTQLDPGACLFARTMQACFERRHNDRLVLADVGHFTYNGGHSQKMAVDMGLGAMPLEEVAGQMRLALGGAAPSGFAHPSPAGGMQSTPAAYAAFLQKIMRGELRMSEFLGFQPVCTRPEACARAHASPVKEAWHYSLNHWVEDDPGTGDGAFSSPGLMGFYPWISADRGTYGVLARQSLSSGAYWDSVQCGRDLRRAWFTGEAQP